MDQRHDSAEDAWMGTHMILAGSVTTAAFVQNGRRRWRTGVTLRDKKTLRFE
jgi:hypothetical protein